MNSTQADNSAIGIASHLKKKIDDTVEFLKQGGLKSIPAESPNAVNLSIEEFEKAAADIVLYMLCFDNDENSVCKNGDILDANPYNKLFPTVGLELDEKKTHVKLSGNLRNAFVRTPDSLKLDENNRWTTWTENYRMLGGLELTMDDVLSAQNGDSTTVTFDNVKMSMYQKEIDSKIFEKYRHFIENESHKGRNCGKGFDLGQPIYRCQECGMDDTCVLCYRCFNPDDHVNHNVMVLSTTEKTTGICDCGDQDAWKSDLNCKADCNCPDYETDPNFKDDVEYFKNQKPYYKYLLSVFLDYFLEIFKSNQILLPFLRKNPDYPYTAQSLIDYANLSIETDKGAAANPYGYYLVLFNDEYHTFSHVDAVLSELGFDIAECAKISSSIDEKGYSVVTGPESFERLFDLSESYEDQQFTVRILTWNALVQMNLCAGIIRGIKKSLEIKNPIFQKEFRLALTEALIETSDVSIQHYVKEINDTYDNGDSFYHLLENRCDNNEPKDSMLAIPTDISLDSKCEYTGYEDVKTYNPIDLIHGTNDHTTRLQSVLTVDIKLWKSLRYEISQLYLSVLATNDVFKNVIADQYADIYATLLNIVAYLDREPQLTLMKECTTQMFSNRSIVNHLASNEGLSKIIWAAVAIFDDFCSFQDHFFLFKKPVEFNASKGFHVAFKQSLYALETIIANIDDLEKILQPDCLFGILCLLQRFNGAYKLKRKTGEHVLREDQFFITYVEYSMSLYTIVNSINKLLNSSPPSPQMKESILMFLAPFKDYIEIEIDEGSYLADDLLGKQPHIDRVSYMNPLHTLLGTLLTFFPIGEIRDMINDDDLLMIVTEEPMITLSLHAQASVGLWVRNGLSVVHQLQFYKDQLRSSAYLIDIYFNQLQLMLSPEKGIRSFLYKWGFLDNDKESFLIDNEVFDDKNNILLLNMISNLYLIMSERNRFLPTSADAKREEELFRANVIYFLLDPPVKYSHLSELLDDHPLFSTLDTVLNEVADYQAPKGINGEGTFSLKKEIYKEVDMINVFGSSLGGFATVEKLSKVLDSEKNDGFVVEPKLRNYEDLQKNVPKFSSFADEPLFVSCIENCLAVAADDSSLDLALNSLHLLHGIILDNRMYASDETFIPESLKTNKIYNNLFKLGFIVDSNKFVKAKAIAVLKLFMASESEYIVKHLSASFFIENLDERLDELAGRRKSFIEDQANSAAQKKLLIKKRQDALLSKFKKNQAKFLKNQQNDISDGKKDFAMDQLDDEKTIICSSCQETNNDDMFVVPCFFDNTPAIRPLNVNGDFTNKWEGSRNDGKNFYIASASTTSGGDYGFDKAAVSCNHPIHLSCLKGYLEQSGIQNFGKSFNYFSCPVCQNLSDCIVPMFNNHLPIENEEAVDLFTDKLIPQNSKKLNNSDSKLKLINENIMLQFFLRAGYEGTRLTAAERATVDNNYVMFALSNTLANSISMIEVSSRLSDEPYLDFLNFNERQYKTLKLLGETIAAYREHNEHLGFNFFASNNIANANRAFQYIVDRYFMSEDSIETSLIFAFNQIFEKSFVMLAAKMENAEILGTECDLDKLFDLKKYSYARPMYLDLIMNQDLTDASFDRTYNRAYQVFFRDRDNYFYSSSNKNIKGNKHLNMKQRLEVLKKMGYTLALGQFKVLLRKTIVFMKMLNLYGSKNAENSDIINGQRLNDGTDPSIFEGDDEKYCDYLISKISNGKHTSIATFVFEGKAFCKHPHPMIRQLTRLDGAAFPFRSDFNRQTECTLTNCYYAKFYFTFFVGEDTGLVKLLDLKYALNDYLIRKKETTFNPYTSDYSTSKLLTESINYEICLECGGEIFNTNDVVSIDPDAFNTTSLRRHFNNKCRSLYCTGSRFSSLVLNPVSNVLKSVIGYRSVDPAVLSYYIIADGTGPYLNKHGESTVDTIKANSTPVFLNKERYDNLNQKWLNLEISGDVIRYVGVDAMKDLNFHCRRDHEKKEFNEFDIYSLYLGTDDLAYTNMYHMMAHATSITPLELRQMIFYKILQGPDLATARKLMMDALFNEYSSLLHRILLNETFKIPALAYQLHNRLVYADKRHYPIGRCDNYTYYSDSKLVQYDAMVSTGDFADYRFEYKDNLNLIILFRYYTVFFGASSGLKDVLKD